LPSSKNLTELTTRFIDTTHAAAQKQPSIYISLPEINCWFISLFLSSTLIHLR
jgi:hypothetical protein